jgi:hypothetical protein
MDFGGYTTGCGGGLPSVDGHCDASGCWVDWIGCWSRPSSLNRLGSRPYAEPSGNVFGGGRWSLGDIELDERSIHENPNPRNIPRTLRRHCPEADRAKRVLGWPWVLRLACRPMWLVAPRATTTTTGTRPRARAHVLGRPRRRAWRATASASSSPPWRKRRTSWWVGARRGRTGNERGRELRPEAERILYGYDRRHARVR